MLPVDDIAGWLKTFYGAPTSPLIQMWISWNILEQVTHSNIISHFETHDILTDSQYGFRKRRSCNTQLIVTINNLAKGLD